MTILMINTAIKIALTRSLLSYYEALERGDLRALATLMTKRSYLMTLKSLGLKRAVKEKTFKVLIEGIEKSEKALKRVETLLSEELTKEAHAHDIALLAFDPSGSNRVAVRYTENGQPKKLFFSYLQGSWKIDFTAGRQKAENLFQAQNIL